MHAFVLHGIKVRLHDASNVVSNVGSKRLGQYGANAGAMLVVRAAGYMMRQIVQYWKQTFGSSHGLHSSIGSIL